MSSRADVLASLLSEVLFLNTVDDSLDGDVDEAPLSETMKSILQGIGSAGAETKSTAVSEYVYDQLSTQFVNVGEAEDNFNIESEGKWDEIFSIDFQEAELEFAVTVYILLNLSYVSLINKQKMGRLSTLKPAITRILEKDPPEHIALPVSELYAQILSTNCNAFDLEKAYRDARRNPKTFLKILNTLGNELSEPQSQSYLYFENIYRQFEIKPARPRICIQLWVSFNNVTSNRILSINDNLFIEIKQSVLCVSNHEFILAMFEGFEFASDVHYGITLNVSTDVLSLFVDGDMVEKIALPLALEENIRALELGSMISSFKVYKFWLWSEQLYETSIKLTDRFSIRQIDKTEFQADEKALFPGLDEYVTHEVLSLVELPGLTAGLFKQHIKQLNSGTLIAYINPHETIQSLKSPTNAEFSINLCGAEGESIVKCLYYKTSSLVACFQTVEFASIVLEMIHSCSDLKNLYGVIEHFIILMRCSSLEKMFIRSFGYDFLGLLLVKDVLPRLHSTLSIPFLTLFFEFCGWNTVDPTASIMKNTSAYANLILNFELWISVDRVADEEPAVEMVRFLIFQLGEMLQNSKFATFNARQCKKLKVLESLTCHQHLVYTKSPDQNFLDCLHKELVGIFRALIKPLSQVEISGLFQFAYYEVKKDLERSAAVIMNSIMLVLADWIEAGDSSAVEMFFNAIPIKIVLLIIECGGSISVVAPSLSIIITFLQANANSYKRFVRSNGFRILFDILKDQSLEDYEELVAATLTGVLTGSHQFRSGPLSNLSWKDITVIEGAVASDVHCLILDLIEWAVLNDVKARSPAYIEEMVTSYSILLTELQQNCPETVLFDPQQSPFMGKVVEVILTLDKPQNAGTYAAASQQMMSLLSDVLFFRLLHSPPLEFSNLTLCLIKGKKIKEADDYVEQFYWQSPFVHTLTRLESFIPAFDALFQQSKNIIPNLTCLLEQLTGSPAFYQLGIDNYVRLHKIILSCYESTLKETSHNQDNSIKNALELCEIKTLFALFSYHDSEKPSASSEEITAFVEATLFHQSVLLGTEHTRPLLDVEKSAFLLASLASLLDASNSFQAQSNVMNCVRIITLHRLEDITAMAHLIDRGNKNLVQRVLSSSISTSDENLLDKLTSWEVRSCFKSYAASQLKKYHKRDTQTVISSDGLKRSEDFSSIFKRREFALEKRLHEISLIRGMFQRDGNNTRNKIVISEDKKLLNFVNDREDELLLFYQHFSQLKNSVRSLSRVRGNEITEVEWTLDSMEDSNRMRKRLIPKPILVKTPSLTSSEAQTDKNSTHVESDVARYERRDSSAISFEVINELEAISIDSLETHVKNRKVLKILEQGDTIMRIWNCSNVIGLRVHEGVLIMGNEYLYFMGGYFYSFKDCNVVELQDAPTEARDPAVELITKGNNNDFCDFPTHEVQRWKLSHISFVSKRPFLLRDSAIELSFENGTNCFFTFQNKNWRDDAYRPLEKCERPSTMDTLLSDALLEVSAKSHDINVRNGLSQHTLSRKVVSVFSNTKASLSFEALKKWQNGQISNFYYLIIVNTLAGRTFNDITQYPVFPWVIADYRSDELDLTNPSTFRDLSKPMGAQSEDRLNQFVERYNALSSFADQDPPFHYGTHYSSAMIVSSYLMRLAPFVDSYLLLQGGKFGHADRLFNSVERAWCSASRENTTDVRELTPEFFYLPDFLRNLNNYDLGTLQSGQKVGDVSLPPWAKGDPKLFVEKNREALESPYVSEHLHQWIDLIFGYKQKGEEAVRAANVFNRLSYPGSVNLNEIDDENERMAVTGIIHNFGQTPLQIFQNPHPKKCSHELPNVSKNQWNVLTLSQATSVQPGHDVHITRIQKDDKITGKIVYKGRPFWQRALSDEPCSFVDACGLLSFTVNGRAYRHGHHCSVTYVESFKDDQFFTSDECGLMKHWQYKQSRGKEGLAEISQYTGHLSPIKKIVVSSEYNLLLSLDVSGKLFSWDVLSSQLLRCIAANAKDIAVSNRTGSVAFADSDNVITVCDINGSAYAKLPFEVLVTSVGFLEAEPTDNHLFSKAKDLLGVGTCRGNIEIVELQQGGPWKIKKIGELVSKTDSPITCVQMSVESTKGESHSEADSHAKYQVLAGNEEGVVFVWN
ncbi:Bph1p [Lachancea thermotolerans CBS 6340]|uniref:Beige protein homolog 1 n=1 Tax=Lachancea thermotolerans (strain ATCC 56472 / CBS 6340 / NRRL Y-8284) TaxID=559295 RepID=C5DKD7_LACTC|nr:KLTH0F03806p [Lachancea thermotolerans CBS 6340]CAR23938.1 KLTH0F03806p [Lachancea thermotolerans CBS 6340]